MSESKHNYLIYYNLIAALNKIEEKPPRKMCMVICQTTPRFKQENLGVISSDTIIQPPDWSTLYFNSNIIYLILIIFDVINENRCKLSTQMKELITNTADYFDCYQ